MDARQAPPGFLKDLLLVQYSNGSQQQSWRQWWQQVIYLHNSIRVSLYNINLIYVK